MVLPSVRPGECYAVREIEPGHFELSRVIPLPRSPKPTGVKLQRLFEESGLTPRLHWEEIRAVTREL